MYTLDKNNVTPSKKLTDVEQNHLNEFMNRIRNEGVSPKEASEGWDANYKKLAGTDNQYEIRLSKGCRATFTVAGTVVTMLQVGGHT